MGTVDLVVLVESPGSVARGIQRVGRAGHQVGEPSTGKIFPKYRGDLLEAAIVVRRMREGLVEEMRYPRNPLDVLAQQIVAACALDEWSVYESRVGECFVLGASTWRIEEINVDRVIVTPAPGEPAKTPFWKGDRPGRPLELGRALGAMVRELRSLDGAQVEVALREHGLDARA